MQTEWARASSFSALNSTIANHPRQDTLGYPDTDPDDLDDMELAYPDDEVRSLVFNLESLLPEFGFGARVLLFPEEVEIEEG